MKLLAPLAFLLTATAILAEPRTSTSYTLAPEALVPGGASSSARFTLDSAVDPAAGPIATSARFTLKAGYVAQLYEVVDLAVTATASSVNEGATNQMSAAALLDDNSTLALDPGTVAWSVVSGPVSGVSAAGLAQTVPTFATMTATVQGQFASLDGTAGFAVVNVNFDDVPPVAGDGLDDAWQFENFDANNDGQLSASEAANAGPGDNPDRDPNDNIVEWLAGFDPNDPNSFFTWRVTQRAGTTVSALANKVVPGTVFRLQTTLDPENGPWTTVDSVTPATENFDQPFADPNATEPARWYRLQLEKAP